MITLRFYERRFPILKLSLIKPQNVPPDGFRYVDGVDGWVDHAWNYQSWIQQEKNHLTANNRPIPEDIESQMETQLCQTLPIGWCDYLPQGFKHFSTSLDWSDVKRALETFGRWITGGAKTVEQEKAEHRALICSRCWYNTSISGCSACQKLVSEVVGQRHTKYDFALKGCAVCKCVLRAKVWFPISVLDKMPDVQKESYRQVPHCWLNDESENYG